MLNSFVITGNTSTNVEGYVEKLLFKLGKSI